VDEVDVEAGLGTAGGAGGGTGDGGAAGGGVVVVEGPAGAPPGLPGMGTGTPGPGIGSPSLIPGMGAGPGGPAATVGPGTKGFGGVVMGVCGIPPMFRTGSPLRGWTAAITLPRFGG